MGPASAHLLPWEERPFGWQGVPSGAGVLETAMSGVRKIRSERKISGIYRRWEQGVREAPTGVLMQNWG